MRVVVEIHGHVRAFCKRDYPFHLLLGGTLDGLLDLIRRRRALGDEFEIDNRHIRCGHADCDAVELAIEFGQHESDGLRGTRLGRDHGEGGRPPPVEVFMQSVEGGLIAGVRMDRRHEPRLDSDCVMQNLGERGKAIRRARGIGNDKMILSEFRVVHSEDHGQIGVIRRCRYENALGASFQVGGSLLLRSKDPGAFERYIDAERLVRQFARISDRSHLDRTCAIIKRVASDLDLAGKAAVDRVEAQQMGIGFNRAEIVDRGDLDVLAL